MVGQLPFDSDDKSMNDRGAVAGAFCRRKGYSADAARHMLATQTTYLAEEMLNVAVEGRALLLKVYADAFLLAFLAK